MTIFNNIRLNIGCGGNDNNFLSIGECEVNCMAAKNSNGTKEREIKKTDNVVKGIQIVQIVLLQMNTFKKNVFFCLFI